MRMEQFKTVDEYIASFPKEVQADLKKIRKIILGAAPPDAEETLMYGLPTVKWNGLVAHYGAFKDHIGFFPHEHAVEHFRAKLSNYQLSKHGVKIPFSTPVPFDLIAEITAWKVGRNMMN